MNKEIRILGSNRAEVRKAEDGKRYIEGYGIVFNEWSQDLGGFVEMIEPEAVTGIDWDGVIGARNHNIDLQLGKVPKTMAINVDERGVRYSIIEGKTSAIQDTLESIERGDIDGSSFVFYVAENGQRWIKPDNPNEPYKRIITQFEKIIEMGPVIGPAYTQTDASVAKRSLGLFKDEQERKVNEILEKQKLEIEMVERKHKIYKEKLRVAAWNLINKKED